MLFTGNRNDLSHDGKRQHSVVSKENALCCTTRRVSRQTPQGESRNATMKSPPIVLGMEREQAYTFHLLHRS